MVVGYDANGNPYDMATGNAVQLVYDASGNAYDANTNQYVDTIIPPGQQTTYAQGTLQQSQWPSTVSNIVSSVFQPSSAYSYSGYPTAGYPGYTSTYNPYYAPSSLNRTPYIPGSGVTTTVGSSGVGLNVSPTMLLIVAVV